MEDRRLLLFFVFAIAILLGWQLLVPAPPPPAPAAAPPGAVTPLPGGTAGPAAAPTPEVATAPAAPAEPRPPRAAAAEQQVVLEDEAFRAIFSNRGAQLRSFVLKAHLDDEGQPLELIRNRQQGPWPLGLVGEGLTPLALDEVLFAVSEEPDDRGRPTLRFEYAGPAGEATKLIRLLGPGLLGLEIEASPPGWGIVLGPGIRNPGAEELDDRSQPRQAVYRSAGEVETEAAPKAKGVIRLPPTGMSWAGVEDNYFLTVFAPETRITEVALQPVSVDGAGEGRVYQLTPFADVETLPEVTADLPRDYAIVVRPEGNRLAGTAYFGAKEYERLAALKWGLEESLQWGMFGFLARPLLWGLLWLHDNVVANYGWAIALLTIAIRLILFPLTWTSQRSMMRMQTLQPRIQAIRNKYKGKLRDKKGRMDLEAQRKMNEEMQELFKSEGANPYGGCLPILAQIPVFFALFTMLRSSVELRHAPWLLWIQDLSVPDPYFVLPVLMGATQIYQQKLTPMSGDPMQRRMMQLFPWMFTIFSLSFPAGLVLYWTVNNIVTIGQTMAFLHFKGKEDQKKARGSRREGKGEKPGPPETADDGDSNDKPDKRDRRDKRGKGGGT